MIRLSAEAAFEAYEAARHRLPAPGPAGNAVRARSLDDIDISLHDGVLTVKGEKHSESKEEGEGYFFSEREYGRFQRTFRLPGDVNDSAVSADFANGVLKIRVPKRTPEKEQARKIKVNAK